MCSLRSWFPKKNRVSPRFPKRIASSDHCLSPKSPAFCNNGRCRHVLSCGPRFDRVCFLPGRKDLRIIGRCLPSQAMKLQVAYSEYEKLGSVVADEIKRAVLLRSATGQLKTWLQLRVKDSTTCSQLRELIMAYERGDVHFHRLVTLKPYFLIYPICNQSGPCQRNP